LSLSPNFEVALAIDATKGRWATVTVRGEVDTVTAPILRAQLETAIAGAHCEGLVVDLASVEFFGPAAVAVLVWARKRIAAEGGSMWLRDPSRPVNESSSSSSPKARVRS